MFFKCLLLLSEPQYVHLRFCPTDFITSLLPQMPRDIWIGLQFLFSTRENKWIDESRLLYSNFHPLLTGRLRKIPLDVSSDFGLLDFSGLLTIEILNIGCIKRKKKKSQKKQKKTDQFPQMVTLIGKQWLTAMEFCLFGPLFEWCLLSWNTEHWNVKEENPNNCLMSRL